MSGKITFADKLAYHRSFSMKERRERVSERVAQFIACYLLPKRVRLWVIIRAHVASTAVVAPEHPSAITAFDLYNTCK